tara:strand:+ start:242 stop:580 length:339 start_codon:yes stop_codon:yes gene_type:complete
MEKTNSTDRAALEILSQVMDEKLGSSNLVAREVSRAFNTGKLADLSRAGLLFESLPRWQKIEVYEGATYLANESKGSKEVSSARRWPISDRANADGSKNRDLQTPLPKFLIE